MTRFIGVRAFLKGGYLDATEPQVIMRHAQPLGVWIPVREDLPLHDPGTRAFVESVLQDREGQPPWWGKSPLPREERNRGELPADRRQHRKKG